MSPPALPIMCGSSLYVTLDPTDADLTSAAVTTEYGDDGACTSDEQKCDLCLSTMVGKRALKKGAACIKDGSCYKLTGCKVHGHCESQMDVFMDMFGGRGYFTLMLVIVSAGIGIFMYLKLRKKKKHKWRHHSSFDSIGDSSFNAGKTAFEKSMEA